MAHSNGHDTLAQVVPLASLQGAVNDMTDRSGSLPSEGMRPAGPSIVLGVRDGNLWLADDVGQPFLVPLTHPGLRARTKTARNDLTGAVATAEKGGPAQLRTHSLSSSACTPQAA